MLNELRHKLAATKRLQTPQRAILSLMAAQITRPHSRSPLSKTLRTTSGPLQRAKPSTLYAKQVLDASSARLERWQFPVNGVNDLVSIEVWVPNSARAE